MTRKFFNVVNCFLDFRCWKGEPFYFFHCHDIKLAIFTFFIPIKTGKLRFKRHDTTQSPRCLVNISVYGLVRHFCFDGILKFISKKISGCFQHKFLHNIPISNFSTLQLVQIQTVYYKISIHPSV